MKKIVRITITVLLLLFLFSAIFFVWASSPKLSEEAYSRLIENNYNATTSNDSIYSVISYNIGYLSGMTNNRAIEKPKSLFSTNLTRTKKLFKKVNPDIIAFQEIDYGSARSYHINQQNEIATLGYNYIAQAVNWDETYVPFPYWPPSMHFGSMLSGQSILSKYPIQSHERIVLERVADAPFYRDALYLERLAQVVKTTIENKTVVLINVHLEAFDKSTRAKQFQYVLQLFKKYAVNYPTILLGDFNSEARNKGAVIHELINMPGVGNAVYNKNNIANTFDSKHPFKRIDYIFYTKESVEYVSGKVLKEFGNASDHLPVEMQFKLK